LLTNVTLMDGGVHGVH